MSDGGCKDGDPTQNCTESLKMGDREIGSSITGYCLFVNFKAFNVRSNRGCHGGDPTQHHTGVRRSSGDHEIRSGIIGYC